MSSATSHSTERQLLRIGDLARATGKTVRAIHLYEERGLLKPATRSSGGFRLYDPSAVERLRSCPDRHSAIPVELRRQRVRLSVARTNAPCRPCRGRGVEHVRRRYHRADRAEVVAELDARGRKKLAP